MKTIVINAFSARRGGGQTYLQNLLQNIDDLSGKRIFIFAPLSLDLPDHPSIIRLKTPWPTEPPLLRVVWEKYGLPRLLKEIHADVLFCPGGLITSKVPTQCRTVTMFRNMIPFDMAVRKKYPLGLTRVRNWLLERAMLSSMIRADLVIFISDFARRVIDVRTRGRTRGGSITIPHGINGHFRVVTGDIPDRPNWLPNGEYLLYVSIFDVYKNQLEVVRGFHLLKQQRDTKEKLVLAGHHSSPYAAKVIKEIRLLGLQDDVILTGNIPYGDLPAVYAHAKINIFASSCENCPNILLEAMGAGRPTLVSKKMPMPEFGGNAVVYFDPASPEDFADKLESLIDNPVDMARYADNAKKQAELFDWEKTASLTWSAISSLHHNKKDSRD